MGNKKEEREVNETEDREDEEKWRKKNESYVEVAKKVHKIKQKRLKGSRSHKIKGL